ncbi:acyl-CoA dehydrogenase [Bacillus mangrovi]|uniref:Acyl-CoA dehydrogenase n=1 Tax=Metabacillus mangrovi TaxID=1491830 RepID=A0A7X2S6J9_9BACI|nr:acyl-CoA dehydrogenase family protein [Metabacillus mangrovi]MTH54594.1 acyl-CoA dehydrogenase [Metabacillus mangrovi]
MTAPAFIKEEHAIFRSSLKKFLQKEALPHYAQWEKDRIIPREFWRKAGREGYLCPWVDEEYGGYNADFGYSVILNEEMEKIGSSLIGFGLHSDITVPYLNEYGTPEQKKRWLPGCVTGDIITAIAMTEPGAGSDLAGIKTTAVKENGYYRLNGQKTFITNGIHADLVVVVCKTDPSAEPAHKGISLLVVEKETIGFHKGKKLDKVGLHAQDTAELYFEDAMIPEGNLLGEEGKGFYCLMEMLQQERLLVGICAQASAERILELTSAYVREREAFGKPISKLQTIQFRLAEMATEVQVGRSFLNDAIQEHMAGKDAVQKVSMAKWWLTEMAKRVASEGMQLHGGYGYMEEYEVARRYRDIPVMAIYAGTNEIMKSIIAKKMGL